MKHEDFEKLLINTVKAILLCVLLILMFCIMCADNVPLLIQLLTCFIGCPIWVYALFKVFKIKTMENNNKKTGIELIAEERQRQIEKEGWTVEHDKQWRHGELAEAAACYAAWLGKPSTDIEAVWPFDKSWWKPSENRIRDLQKAGALIAAEIDRLLNS